jgi:hypothetical protein
MNDKRNKSDRKQEVNSAARDVESKPSHQPHGQQNKKQYQKDEVRYCAHFSPLSPASTGNLMAMRAAQLRLPAGTQTYAADLGHSISDILRCLRNGLLNCCAQRSSFWTRRLGLHCNVLFN